MRARSDSPNPGAEYPDFYSPLRPTIEASIATQTSFRGPKYLVDKIIISQQRRNEDLQETFRIWLSDGQKCVQATLRQHAHRLITSGRVRVGSVVRLLDYEVKQFPRANGAGFVSVLAVGDLHVEDHDGREALVCEYEEHLVADSKQSEPEDSIPATETQCHSGKGIARPFGADEEEEKDSIEAEHTAPNEQSPHDRSHLSTPRKRKAFDDAVPLSPLDPNVPGSQGRARKRLRRQSTFGTPVKKNLNDQTSDLRARLIALQSTPTKQRLRATTETPSPSPSKQMHFTDPSPRRIQTMPAPQPSPTPSPSRNAILGSVKITPLSEMTGVKATRNKVHNILAIITHVNPCVLVRKGFPDSRELLVMDASTVKQVHVTVFIDAENFLPEVGTVAVFRELTTHEWNGGSLKAYATRCAGKRWFIPEYFGWRWQEEGEMLKECLENRPEAKILPDRIWWTERGHYSRPQDTKASAAHDSQVE